MKGIYALIIVSVLPGIISSVLLIYALKDVQDQVVALQDQISSTLCMDVEPTYYEN